MAYFDHFATGRSTGLGDWITARTIEHEFRFLAPHFPRGKQTKILEIGPGHGELAARVIAGGFVDYHVVEPNPLLRAKLEKVGVQSVRSYLIPALQEADGSYDAIIVCDVFEHLNDAREAQRFVAEAHRVLRPGGILFILSPDLMDWKEDFYNCDFSHSNPTTVRRVHEIFLNEGMVTVRFGYSYACFQGAIGFLLSRVVRSMTFWTVGEDLDFKPYKLRLTFLRRFLIIGRKPTHPA